MRDVFTGSTGIVVLTLAAGAWIGCVLPFPASDAFGADGFTGTFFQAASVNRPPQLDSIPDRMVDEQTLLTFPALASDPDSPPQQLTFSLGTGALNGATIDPQSGVFSWTPTEAQGPGTNFFSIIVADNGSPSLTATQNFTVMVQEANRPPVFPVIPDQTINEGAFLVASALATDPDIPFQSLSFTLGPGAPVGVNITPGGLITWTPSEAQGPSTNSIFVIATDSGQPSLSTTQTFVVTVREVNLAPQLTSLTDRTVREGEFLTFTATAVDADRPPQVLTFTLGDGAPTGAAIDPQTGVFTWTLNEAQGGGRYQIGVLVTDNGTPPLIDARSFLVDVLEVNSPPAIGSIGDITANAGGLVQFVVPASDPDVPLQPLTYALDTGAPAGAAVSGSGLFTWTPSVAQVRTTNTLRVMVSDGSLSATQSFKITVLEANFAPVLGALTNRTVSEGQLLSFLVQASDANGPSQTLTFSLGAGAPAGAAIDPQSGLLTWTPNEAQGGDTYQIGVLVTDNGTPPLNVAGTFTVTVNEVNSPPAIGAMTDLTVNVGGFVVVPVPASDPDVPLQPLFYALGAGAPAGAAVSSSGLFTWTPAANQVRTTNTLRVIVSDGSLSATQSFVVTVLEANLAPVLGALTNRAASEGQLLSFTVQATDANGPSQALTFSLGAGAPTGAAIDPQSGLFTWTPNEGQGGDTYQIGVLVTDNGTPPLNAAGSFLVDVLEVNSPPVIGPIADLTVNVGGFVQFAVPASDPDLPLQPLSYALGAGAPAGAAVSASGLFTWTPGAAQVRTTNTLRVIVGDGSLSATQSFKITVLEANQAPVLGGLTNRTAREGELVTFLAEASDPNGASQTFTFSLGAGAPAGATIDPQSGVFTWTPNEAQGGASHQIGVIVTDNGTPPLSAARSFLVDVLEVNSPPVIGPMADVTVNVGGFVALPVPASDADVPLQPLSYALGAGAPAGAAVSSSGLFTWTPAANQVRTTNALRVIVSDGSLSATQSFVVTVLEANLAPVLGTLTNRTIGEGGLLTFTAQATDPNGPSQTLTFSLGAGVPAGAAIDPQSGLFTWTPNEAQGGDAYQVAVFVTDNGTPPLNAAGTFIVTVNEVNSPPVVSPIADLTVNVGGLAVFAVPASDPDLPLQPFSYALGAGAPAGAAISTSGLFTWTPTAAQVRTTNTLRVIVSDGSLSATQSFKITVLEANVAPVLGGLTNRMASEGQLISFLAEATDPNGPSQTLTFSLGAGAPTGAAIDPQSGLFTWTPNEAQGGDSYQVAVFVTDNGTPPLNAAGTFTVAVNEVNNPPVIGPMADVTINVGGFVVFPVPASDQDLPLQPLSYALGLGAPTGASVSASGLFTWTPAANQVRTTNTLRVIVSDGSLSATQSFKVTVLEANLAPVLGVLTNRTVSEGELLTFTAQATDPNGASQTLTFSLGPGAPTGAAIDPQSGLFTWTPNEAQGGDAYQVAVFVTDNGTPPLNAAGTFTVTVNEINSPPVIGAMADVTINVGGFVVFPVPASDPDVPLQPLSYGLGAGAPTGASVSAGGLFTWTPAANQVRTTNTLRVIVSDGSLSTTQSFKITVLEANVAPVLGVLTNRTANEGQLLSFLVQASDANGPSQTLTFSLGAGAPTGAAIDPQSGLFTWTPNEAQGGDAYQVAVFVTDNGTPPLNAAGTFTVTVNEVNSPPVIGPIADLTVNVGGLAVFAVPASDPDVPLQPLSYALGAGAPAGAAVSASGLFTWTPSAAQVRTTNTLRVIVSDGSLSATQSFKITVLEANLAPVLGMLTNRTASEGQLVSFLVEATDPNGPSQTLTFSLGAGAPAGAAIDPESGVFTWAPNEAQGGDVYQIAVFVTDNGTPPLNAAATFIVTVNEVNSPPVLAPIADVTANVGGFVVFPVPASDPDVPAQPLTYSLGPGAPTGAAISTSGLFTWTPGAAHVRTTNTLRAIVGDGSLSATQSFKITVLEANLAPVLGVLTNRTAREGELVTFLAEASDPNGASQTLTFSLGAGAPAGATIDPQSGVFTWTPNEAQGGASHQIGVIVTDNGTPPLSAARSFLVDVLEVNSPPAIGPMPDVAVNVGGFVVLPVPASDPDVPLQLLSYALGPGAPTGAGVSASGLFTWTPAANQVRTTNTLRVIVSDGSLSATQSFVVTVLEANLAPVLGALTNRTTSEGQLVTFVAQATDPNGPSQTLTFSLGSGAPTGAAIDPQSGLFTWTPNEAHGGDTYQVAVLVTDNGTPPLLDAKSFLVNVLEVNSPPVIGPMADVTMNVGGFVQFDVPADDPDVPFQPLQYSLGPGAPSGAAVNAAGLFTWTPSAAQVRTTNTLRVIVSDGSLSATQSFKITVLEANLAPVLVVLTNRMVSEGQLLTFLADATDPNGPSQTLTFSLGAGAPGGAAIDPQNGLFTWTPNETQGGASYQIGVIVADNGTPSLSDARSFTVTVLKSFIVAPRLFNLTLAGATFSTSVSNTVPGLRYQLERKDPSGTSEWQAVGQQVQSSGGIISLNDPTATNARFIYRARVQ